MVVFFRNFLLLAFLSSGQLFSSPVFTWTGNEDPNLSTSANWQGGIAPSFSGDEMLVFGNGGEQVLVDVTAPVLGMVLNRVVDENQPTEFQFLSLFGDGLQFNIGSGGILATPSSPQTFRFSGESDYLNLSSNQTWDTNSNARIIVGGAGLGGEFNLTKNGSGTVVLEKNSGRSNSSTATTIRSGVLEIQSAAALNSSPAARLVLDGGTLLLRNDDNTTFTGTNTSVTANSSIQTATINLAPHPIHTLGKLRIGSSTLTVSIAFDGEPSTGAATVQMGEVTLDGNPVFDTAKSTAQDLVLELGAVSEAGGARGLSKSGNGTLLLTGDSTYSGPTLVNAGRLEVSENGRLGGGMYSGNIAIGGTFSYNGSATQVFSGILSGTGGFLVRGLGAVTLGGSNSFNGPLSLGPASSLELSASGRLGGGNFTANFSNSGSFTNSASSNQAISGIVSGAGSISQNGPSTLTLTGNNTYTGATVINSGTVSIPFFPNSGVAGPLGNPSNSADNLTLGGGTLLFTGSNATTNRNFRLADGTTGTLSVSNSSSVLTISGSSAPGSGALIKSGPGTLVLGGNAEHSGGTTVAEGQLRINANHNGTVVVENGASLGGSGTIDSLATLNAGASLLPGNSVGTLTFRNGLTLNSTSTVRMNVSSANGSADRIDVTGGSLEYAGSLVFETVSMTGVTNNTYTLFAWTASTGNWTSVSASGAYSGNFTQDGFLWTRNTGDGFLWTYDQSLGTLAVVPEPTTAALLGVSALIFLWNLKRKKSGVCSKRRYGLV